MSSSRALSLLPALTLLLLALGLALGGQQEAGPQAAAPTQRHSDMATAPSATATEDAARSTRSGALATSAATATPTRIRAGEPAPRTTTGTATAESSPTRSPTTTSAPSSTAPASPTSAAATTAVATSPGDQVAWVSLAAAGVNDPVSPQGLSSNGTVSPPQGQVIWFTGYARVEPGHVGTAVIAAHVSYRGTPDAFAELYRTEPGDVVRVGYRDGTVLEIPVRRTEIVDKGELQYSTTVWGQNSSTRRVVLITCDDTYGYRPDGHRAANFVVVAEL